MINIPFHSTFLLISIHQNNDCIGNEEIIFNLSTILILKLIELNINTKFVKLRYNKLLVNYCIYFKTVMLLGIFIIKLFICFTSLI